MTPSRSAGEPTRDQIVSFLERCADRGVPPTVREIGDAVGLRSPASVHRQLRTLEEEGRIICDGDGRSRSWRITKPKSRRRGGGMIPIVGRIAAGEPIDSLDGEDEFLPLPPGAFASSGDVVALRVEGNSMTDAGILSGDYAIIRRQPEVENGEVAAVSINGEGTLKVWKRVGEGRITLEPRARGFEAIRLGRNSGEISVFGRLVGVTRLFGEG